MRFQTQRLFFAFGTVLFLLLVTAGWSLASPTAQAQDQPTAAPDEPSQPGPVYLPIVNNDAMTLAGRLGFGAGTFPISRYPNVRDLRAGWYLNWSTTNKPLRPGGIEYAQVIFVHQKLACGDRRNGDREACPYAQPLDYAIGPALENLDDLVARNPGQIWFIGNEMDRRDWNYCAAYEADGRTCKPGQIKSDGQGEILPETYVRAYHDAYEVIKAADPTARVGIGGIIQATPLRLQYLTLVWDAYRATYSVDMPVDIWNVHNFALREERNNYGADIPPGLPGDPQVGAYTDNDCTHTDMAVFDQQIRAFRQWMKDRGQQQKELYVTEYGVLYSQVVNQPLCHINFADANLVHNFMLSTFDYFLNTKDCDLGLAADDCRLVQRWLWFSLDHGYTNQAGNIVHTYANYYASLVDIATFQFTEAGRLFAEYAQQHMDELQYK